MVFETRVLTFLSFYVGNYTHWIKF